MPVASPQPNHLETTKLVPRYCQMASGGNYLWLRITTLEGQDRKPLKEAILVSTMHHFKPRCGGLSPPGHSPRPSSPMSTSPPCCTPCLGRQNEMITNVLESQELHREAFPHAYTVWEVHLWAWTYHHRHKIARDHLGASEESGISGWSCESQALLVSPWTHFYTSCKSESFLSFLLWPELFPEYYVRWPPHMTSSVFFLLSTDT